MRIPYTLLVSCALTIGSVHTVAAQSLEVFGGYSVGKMKASNDANSDSFNGWNASATAYPWKRIGFTADFAGFYGETSPTVTAADGSTTTLAAVNTRQHSFLFGPQIRLLRRQRFETSFRALFGGANGDVPGATYDFFGQTKFAALFGSNFDLNVNRRLALRLSPAMYVTTFNGQTQRNFRFSIGPVFRFGGDVE